ncbi:MAG: MBOAT family O-acyltransferase [Desulfobacterales bacterium]|jgi:D-alanyl-lipoteichoic acid acyltransferase DltB (MBOAT superfamily)|nr:MBOAT family O-acyltransferase [Desulfobacterales bacterium]
MLFNSFPYIALFFPIACSLFFLSNRLLPLFFSRAWLLIASLAFYALGSRAVPLLILSIGVNYWIGTHLQKLAAAGNTRHGAARRVLILGLVFNIGLLGWFKYADFFVWNVNQLTGYQFPLPGIVLPLAISFYTFQQISFLVDSYRGGIRCDGWLDYALYVTFFPQLISGPIVRYLEFAPQLQRWHSARFDFQNASIGLSLFFTGLVKTAAVAHIFGNWADQGFSNSDSLSLIDGWTTSLSYTFQIYLDFSGYTDMALGAARFFNIELPLNFNSPYQAVNIQDFWRRWHMTLSRFLRDYIYIPLGGNKRGEVKTGINVILTFLIGGIWHGAGWTFIVWGALHGIGAALLRVWWKTGIRLPTVVAAFFTFNFINITWVFFRAESIEKAMCILKSMMGCCKLTGFSILHGIPAADIIIASISILTVFLGKNTNSIPGTLKPGAWAALRLTATILMALLYLNSSIPKEFLYFDF